MGAKRLPFSGLAPLTKVKSVERRTSWMLWSIGLIGGRGGLMELGR